MQKTTTVYTINDVAAFLGVSRKTVNRLVQAGKLSAFRISGRGTRIRSIDLEAFMTANRRRTRPVLVDYGSDMPPIYAAEALCASASCSHPFTAHNRRQLFNTGGFTGAGLSLAMQAAAERVGITHTHACAHPSCYCNSWREPHTLCPWCGSSLTECELLDGIMRSRRTQRVLRVVVTVCKDYPGQNAICTPEFAYALAHAIATNTELPAEFTDDGGM